MVAANGYSTKLQEELAQQERRKPVFDVQDFEHISEISVDSMMALHEFSLDGDVQAFAENFLENILNDKLQFTWEAIAQMNTELRSRKYILFQSHEDIEKEILKFTVYFNQLPGMERGICELKANTQTQIVQLQREQRSNMVVAWQDAVRLRKDLREFIEKYQALLRTRSLLKMGGD